jgi:hypothetical protein
MYHPMRVATRTDMIVTKVRVETFEILKQRSNRAMEKMTILTTEGFHKREPSVTFREAYDHINNAQGRLKLIAINSRPMAFSEF